MSHYLQSIAARSLDAVPKVEPRLAARFESGIPVTGAVNLAAEEPDGVEGRGQRLASPRAFEARQPSPPAVSVVSTQARGIAPVVRPIETIRPAMAPVPSMPQSSPPTEIVRPAEPVSPIVDSPQPGETIRPSLPTVNTFPSSEVFAKEPSDPTLSSRFTDFARSPHSAPDTPSFSSQSSPQEVSKDSQAIQPVPVEASLPTTPVPVAYPAELSTFQAAIPPDQHASSQSPPAPPPIQVTIGRIDVRAVSSPSQPRAVKPTAPKRSLNDYLKARQKSLGGRG